MIKRTLVVFLSIALLLALSAFAQRRRDPLNSNETDQLREAKQEPDKRLKLYVQFAKARMETIEHLRTDPRFAADRGPQIHDLLEDLGNIVEEMDDNVDMYTEGKWDIRKAMKEVIQADTEFQLKLRQLKESAESDPASGAELKENYEFALQDTTEAVNASLDSARKTMDELETMAKAKQLRKLE
jgi:hypothetical protein